MIQGFITRMSKFYTDELKDKSLAEIREIVRQRSMNDILKQLEDKLLKFEYDFLDRHTFDQTYQFDISIGYPIFNYHQLARDVCKQIRVWAKRKDIVIGKIPTTTTPCKISVKFEWKLIQRPTGYFTLKNLTMLGLSSEQDQNEWTKFLTQELYDPRLLEVIHSFLCYTKTSTSQTTD